MYRFMDLWNSELGRAAAYQQVLIIFWVPFRSLWDPRKPHQRFGHFPTPVRIAPKPIAKSWMFVLNRDPTFKSSNSVGLPLREQKRENLECQKKKNSGT